MQQIRTLPQKNAVLLALAACLSITGNMPAAPVSAYNPLDETVRGEVPYLDLTVSDTARKREIPIRVYMPSASEPVPVVFFSHGLGGNCKGSAYLGRHWAARGYVAVFLQHPGSDDSVWRDEPAKERFQSLETAANGNNFMLRVRDVPAVLDQLTEWNHQPEHPLANHMDLSKVGMSGHSFGAVTTQAVSGQCFLGRRAWLREPRIDAAIAFSPSGPRTGSAEKAFGGVQIPWMLMTGTHDTAPIGHADVASRLSVFPALPPGDKYELVLNKAEHSAFTERRLPGDGLFRNPNHHRVILALSTAFWDAYLKEDAAALAWLKGDAPRKLMEKEDRWQLK